jgi:hypothetical protein
MAIVKSYVRYDDTATLVCPGCTTARNVSVGKLRHANHKIKYTCPSCQQTSEVLFDFRRHYRKPVNLTGAYEIISEGGIGFGLMHINNISRSGISFTVAGKHRIEEGQELWLEFELDDKKKTLLQREAIVKSVRQDTIGCELKAQLEEKELGFYLHT